MRDYKRLHKQHCEAVGVLFVGLFGLTRLLCAPVGMDNWLSMVLALDNTHQK